MKKEDIESLNLEGKMIGFYHVSLTNDIRKPMFSVGRLLKVTNTSLIVSFYGQKQIYDLRTILSLRELRRGFNDTGEGHD